MDLNSSASQAARVLMYEHFGLGYLLKRHCNEVTDKKYQLADWRVRPLPKEMLVYARKDTHFLLYIADIMRNELLVRQWVPFSIILL